MSAENRPSPELGDDNLGDLDFDLELEAPPLEPKAIDPELNQPANDDLSNAEQLSSDDDLRIAQSSNHRGKAIAQAIASKQAAIRDLPKFVEALPVLLLPGPSITITACATQAFSVLAKQNRHFLRDQIIFELVDNDEKGRLIEVDPSSFRSALEHYFWLGAVRTTPENRVALIGSRCSVDTAAALLKAAPRLKLVPKIKMVTAAPVFTEKNGQIGILQNGYHNVLGGIYVSRSRKIVEVPLKEAVPALLAILSEFNFTSPADKSRGAASAISPALRLGGLLKADFPLDLSEADEPQSGKTYRQRINCALYGEHPLVINKNEDKFGVGSLDERISTALISGSPFIMFENVRGEIKSQLLESALRGTGLVMCRTTYSRPVQIETDLICWMLSSNKIDTTSDLALRSLITRIRKQPPDFKFKRYPEGNLLAHVEARCDYLLSCVLAVLREWYAKGKQRTGDNRHDFQEYAQTLDWIVQNILDLPPLLEGHQNEQQRLGNPDLNWLRAVCIYAEKQNWFGKEGGFTSGQIAELCETYGVQFPGVNGFIPDQQRSMITGKLLKRLFREFDERATGGFIVKRETREHYDARQRKTYPVHFHLFRRAN